MPRTLAIGIAQHVRHRSGETGPSTEMPMNTATAPTPTSCTFFASSPASSAATPSTGDADTHDRTALGALSDRSIATSRSAAIGGTLDARRAGRTADRTVTTTPTAIEMTTVLVCTTVVPVGMSRPTAASSAWSSLGDTDAGREPERGGERPRRQRLRRVPRVRTWRPLAPIARSIAISLVRCDTMIEKVLLMMKAPTNIAMPAKIIMNVPNAAMSSWIASWSSFVNVRAGDDLDAVADEWRAASATSASSRDTVLGDERDAVDAARLGQHGLGGGVVEEHHRGAARRVGGAELRATPTMVASNGAPLRQHRGAVTRHEAGCVGGVLVDDDLVRGWPGHGPRTAGTG